MSSNDACLNYEIDSTLIEECFLEAEVGLRNGEVPVGCLIVRAQHDANHKFEILARSHNRSNEFRNALHHAEFNCVNQIVETFGHQYANVLRQAIVIVTLEPCIMCCRMLRMLNIKAVLFGARNDRFGGAGSVYDVHNNPLIKSPPLTCIAKLDANRAIELLQKFYEQNNESVPKHRTIDRIKSAK